MNKPIVLCAAALYLISVWDSAIAESKSEKLTEIVVVVGTRTEREINEVAATIDVKTKDQIERELAQSLEDLFRFEPGISASGTGSRFGFDGFSIRGIGGNRVLTLVDGIRVPEEFSFGPFLSARRDFIDIDSLGRAEVARGPISSLYGSDALGGVVALTTHTPQDYLEDDKGQFTEMKLANSGADGSTAGRFAFAAGNGRLAALGVHNQRKGQETENAGEVGGIGVEREIADPQDIQSRNSIMKLSLTPSEKHTTMFSFDHYENETDTRILSDYGTTSRGVTTARRDAEDSRTRTQVSFGYAYKNPIAFADSVETKVYYQTSESEQLTDEDRSTASGIQQRQRRSVFEQTIYGSYAQLGKAFTTGKAQHFLTYGLEYYQTDNENLRDGATFDATGGEIAEFFPFPTRDFPLTTVTQSALFLQDEITLFDGRFLLSPSIRYDRYEADVDADEIYISGNPGTPPPENYQDEDITAKLGVVYALTDAWATYARYSEGFRAPPYDDVNVGFSNFVGGYKTISNPALKSETSQGVELGLRLDKETAKFSFAYFRNDYENFIDSLAAAPEFASTQGIDPSDNLLTFQSVNRTSVVIEGAEFAGEYQFTQQSWLSNISLKAAVAYAEGENDETGQPLNSIEPLTGVLGLNYEPSHRNWGANVLLTLVEAKDESDIDNDNPRMATSGYGIADLLAYWKIGKQTQINLGLFNIGDKTYIRWADTLAIGDDSPMRFSQPGFNFAASLKVEI